MTKQDVFYKCFDVVLEREGGNKFHIVKDDPGGATKYGVSLRAYKADYPTATERTIQGLTYDAAAAFALKNYWEPLQCDYMEPSIALVVFDHGFNRGIGSARRLIQQAITGNVDSKATDSINLYYLKRTNTEAFLGRLRDMRGVQYERIANANPKLKKFLNGWINRVNTIHNIALQWERNPWYNDNAVTKEA